MEALTITKLREFDLEKELEKTLLNNEENQKKLTEFLSLIGQIYTVDQFIKDCPSFPKAKKNIINEEIGSSIGATLAIEGIVLDKEGEDMPEQSLREVDLQAKIKNKQQQKENTQKAYKYILDTVDNCVGEFTYSEEQIKKIHHLITDNVESVSPNYPGEYRDTGAWVGNEPRRRSLLEQQSEIIGAMREFVEWLNKNDIGFLTSYPIIKAIMAHYYLVEIHPFGDGNGRTARALEALILYENFRSPCFSNLAQYWSKNRNEYIINLGHIRDTLNPMGFLMLGIKGYLEEVKKVKSRVLKKVKQLMLQDYVQYLYREDKILLRVLNILMLLIDIGKIPYKNFLSTIEPIYTERKERTRYRDFKTMEDLRLIRITKEKGKKSIEPNFEKIEELEYGV